MPITARAVMVAAALSAFAAAPVAAEEPQPGMWRVTTRGLVPGTPGADNSHSICITLEMARNLAAFFANPEAMRGGGDCQHTHQFTGITLSWQMSCAGLSPMSGTGTITFDSPQHYAGTFTAVGSGAGRPMSYSISMEGQRLGDCRP
jgi:hypothetical protein